MPEPNDACIGSAALHGRRAGSLRRRRRGFTLLEVMASVAVIGLVYTLLAQVSMVWLQRSGESNRKLEAGMLADRYLGNLESQVLTGSAPEAGTQTFSEDLYQVEVEVQPFALAELASQLGLELELGGDPQAPRPFLETVQGQGSPLLQLRVRVLWDEGIHERSTARTSFAVDPEAASALLESLQEEESDRDEDEDEDEALSAAERARRALDRADR